MNKIIKKPSFPYLFSFRKVTFILLLLITGSVDLNSQAKQNLQHSIDDLLVSWGDRQQPGISIAIVHDGSVVNITSAGMANIKKDITIDSNTQFWIASVTKQFTAAAIYQLASQKKLSLHNSIRNYIPELPSLFQPVTINHLIHHTSGIRDGFVLTALSKKPESEYTNENVLHYLKMQEELNFQPGSKFEYNNSGYVLLAIVIERISGLKYADFLKRNLFIPVGMNKTYVSGSFPDNDLQAEGYHDAGNTTFKEGHFEGNTYGSTGIITTITDMVRWTRFIQHPEAVSGLTSIASELLTTGELANGTGISYAGGLERFIYKNLPVYEHFGADEGFKADILYFPSHKVSVTGLTNNGSFYELQKLLYKIGDLVLGLESKQDVYTESSSPDSIVYYYNQDVPQLIKVQYLGSSAAISNTPAGYAAPYLFSNNDTLLGTGAIATRYLQRKAALQSLDVYYNNNDTFERIQLVTKTEGLSLFSGEYYSKEIQTSFKIISDSTVLRFEFIPGLAFDLFRISEKDFVFDYLGANYIQFTESGFTFSREGCRKLFFRKQ